MKNTHKQHRLVAVSGGFDPIHVGHVRMLLEAKVLGDKLIVILNNDNWLLKKKGFVFMPEKERKEILEAIRGVDEVIISHHKPDPTDMSVCQELEMYRPDVFAKGGDRVLENTPEVATCKKIGCEVAFNVGHGGKVQSSSWLLKEFTEKQDLLRKDK